MKIHFLKKECCVLITNNNNESLKLSENEFLELSEFSKNVVDIIETKKNADKLVETGHKHVIV